MLKRTFRFHLLAFLLLFLNAQLAVAVHAAEHPFHKHVVSCNVFMAAEQEQAAFAQPAISSAIPQRFEALELLLPSHALPFIAHFQSRAPPFSA